MGRIIPQKFLHFSILIVFLFGIFPNSVVLATQGSDKLFPSVDEVQVNTINKYIQSTDNYLIIKIEPEFTPNLLSAIKTYNNEGKEVFLSTDIHISFNTDSQVIEHRSLQLRYIEPIGANKDFTKVYLYQMCAISKDRVHTVNTLSSTDCVNFVTNMLYPVNYTAKVDLDDRLIFAVFNNTPVPTDVSSIIYNSDYIKYSDDKYTYYYPTKTASAVMYINEYGSRSIFTYVPSTGKISINKDLLFTSTTSKVSIWVVSRLVLVSNTSTIVKNSDGSIDYSASSVNTIAEFYTFTTVASDELNKNFTNYLVFHMSFANDKSELQSLTEKIKGRLKYYLDAQEMFSDTLYSETIIEYGVVEPGSVTQQAKFIFDLGINSFYTFIQSVTVFIKLLFVKPVQIGISVLDNMINFIYYPALALLGIEFTMLMIGIITKIISAIGSLFGAILGGVI